MGEKDSILTDVKTLLEIDGEDRDKLIRLLISTAEKQVIGKLQRLKVAPRIVPEPIQYIITEIVIARYNRMGSEGLQNESVEGYSATYNQNDLEYHQSAIDDYIKQTDGDSNVRVVRFI